MIRIPLTYSVGGHVVASGDDLALRSYSCWWGELGLGLEDAPVMVPSWQHHLDEAGLVLVEPVGLEVALLMLLVGLWGVDEAVGGSNWKMQVLWGGQAVYLNF